MSESSEMIICGIIITLMVVYVYTSENPPALLINKASLNEAGQ
jgi:hypothetical protein